MNLERLEQAIAIMKRAGRFNIEKWQYNDTKPKVSIARTEDTLHTCGSAACFGGWIAVSPEWAKYGGTPGDAGIPTIPGKHPDVMFKRSGSDALAFWLDCDSRIIDCIVYSEIGPNTLLWDKETMGVFSIFYNKPTAQVTPADVIEKLEHYRTKEGIVKAFTEYLERYKAYYAEYTDSWGELAKRFGLWETVSSDEVESDFTAIQYIIDDFTSQKVA